MLLDLRLVFRRLWRDKRYLISTPLMLGLGIAANAIIYSLLYFSVIKPLAYPDSDKIVRIYRATPDAPRLSHSPADFYDLLHQSKTLSQLAAYSFSNVNLSRPGETPKQAYVFKVSADFFSVLGMRPKLGRIFLPSDDQSGAHQVAVISDSFWMQEFAGKENAIGQQVMMDGEPVEIVGVMPRDFDSLQLWGKIDIWRPLAYYDATKAVRDRYWLSLIGRIQPTATARDVKKELSVIYSRLSVDFPQTNAHSTVNIVPLKDTRVSESARSLIFLVGGLSISLLILICANLANLQLVRLLASANEIAMRTALGASVWRAISPLVLESLVISVIGAFVGYFVAIPGIRWIDVNAAFSDHEHGALSVGGDILVFAFIVAILSAIFFGALPAIYVIRHRTKAGLSVNTRTATESPRQKSMRSLLISVEVAVGLTLMTAAVYCTRGVSRLENQPLGWDPGSYATVSLYLPTSIYSNEMARRNFVRASLERLKEIPGIDEVAISQVSPVWGYYSSRRAMIEGQMESEAMSRTLVFYNAVTENYFSTARIALVSGRVFTRSDNENSQPIAIVNKTMAKLLWPGLDPIGKRLSLVDSPRTSWLEVVGVVDDIHTATEPARPETRFQVYRPLYQDSGNWLTINLRPKGVTPGLRELVGRAVAQVDTGESIYGFGYASDEIIKLRSGLTFSGRVLLCLAAFGALILAFGIYGVLSNSVAQRMREIAIRRAIGAPSSSIVRLVLSNLFVYVAVGGVVGLMLSAVVVRILGQMTPILNGTLSQVILIGAGIAVGMFVFVAVCAIVPAYLATLIDPIETLKSE